MKRTLFKAVIFFFVLAFSCWLIIFIFQSSTSINSLGKDTFSNVGSFIGGVTSPLLGLISSIFLYLALSKQTESNNQQQLKNESDIIFLLLNQLETELASFYYSYTNTKHQSGKEDIITQVRLTGIEALNHFAFSLTNDQIKTFDFKFNDLFPSSQLLLIARSYKLVQKRISITPLNQELKTLFNSKLAAFFNCRLEYPLRTITGVVGPHEHFKDGTYYELQEFYQQQTIEVQQNRNTK